jgi:hypothetical protein
VRQRLQAAITPCVKENTELANDYRDYEKACVKIRKQNERLLSDFEDWLNRKGLSETTVRGHVQNSDFYVNEYLLYEDAVEAAQGTHHVGMFLGDWFIRKATWSSEAAIRSNAASLKKFYDFMQAQGLVQEEAVRELRETIKENLPDWLAALRRYENLSYDDPDEDWGAWRFPPEEENEPEMEAIALLLSPPKKEVESNIAKQHGLRVGDTVVVKPGIMCPDYPSLSLAGWQGQLSELYLDEGTLLIRWDSATLKAIPDDYITQSEIEGLDWEAMVLEVDEVEAATPQGNAKALEKERDRVAQQIMARHRWDYLADENPGIREVLGNLDNTSMVACLEAWEAHLEKALHFPFEAKVMELTERGPIRVGDRLVVDGFAFSEDLYGILVHVRRSRERYVFPLCDLEATDANSPNYQPLRDYVVWFANC